MGEAAQYAIKMHHVTKTFGKVVANKNVDLELKTGEILALLGENGSGKTTLMNMLSGIYFPDYGEIYVKGKEVTIRSPKDSFTLGIGMIHQHFKLVDVLTAAENIVLGLEGKTVLKRREINRKVAELAQKYGFDLDPTKKVYNMSVSEKQTVEILKVLYKGADILILDEPTAVLTPQETEKLFAVLKNMKKHGKSIIIITHKLNEIKAVADRCTVIRKGKYVATVDVTTTSKEELSKMMVGRDVNFIVEKGKATPGQTVLKVENLNYCKKNAMKNALTDINFEVKRGEIVCIAGIDGNGQSELVYALTGMLTGYTGKIILNNEDITHYSVRQRNLKGISHIPEDRHKHGLVLDYNLAENMILKNYFNKDNQKHGFLKFENIYNYADRLIEKFDVRSGQGSHSIVRGMSGGNQQKAIIAREIESNCDLLIAVQPTRGLDVGAIEFIHKQLIQQRDEGHAVLLISLELDEVMNVSDRILVMYEGEIVTDLNPKETNVEELGLYMAGSKRGVGYEK